MSVDMAWGAVQDEVSAPDTSYADQYRVLSSQAVASCAFGVLGVSNLLNYQYGFAISVVPLLGLFLGMRALWIIRRHPDQYSGRALAMIGAVLSILFLIGGWTTAAVVYATEVPDGYQRISYNTLAPEDKNQPDVIPANAQELDGKRVFIKGYMYPGAQNTGIKQFILCRDNGDCCYGGTPKVSDMIQVNLVDPLRMQHKTYLRSIAGTFRVKPTEGVDDRGQVLYQLDADYAK